MDGRASSSGFAVLEMELASNCLLWREEIKDLHEEKRRGGGGSAGTTVGSWRPMGSSLRSEIERQFGDSAFYNGAPPSKPERIANSNSQ